MKKVSRRRESPTNKSKLQRVQEMTINIPCRFVALPDIFQTLTSILPNIRKIGPRSPLEQAFDRWKQVLSSYLFLGDYDLVKAVVVSADAFPFDLGAVIRQSQTDGKFARIVSASMLLCVR